MSLFMEYFPDTPNGTITLVSVENGFDGEFQTVEEYDEEIKFWEGQDIDYLDKIPATLTL